MRELGNSGLSRELCSFSPTVNFYRPQKTETNIRKTLS